MALSPFRAETPEEVKACCAVAYESPWARLLLGEALHPGGIELTLRLGDLLGLDHRTSVVDVACGQGSSAIALAREFGCRVTGVDLSEESIRQATAAAAGAGVSHLVSFRTGDAERLPLEDGTFDALICECAFCTFPAKDVAAREFLRVLRPGGHLGLSDVTRDGPLPRELDTLLGWVACLADARPLAEYASLLTAAGAVDLRTERHDLAISDLARSVRFRLLGAEVLARLGKGPVPLDEVLEAKRITRTAAASVAEGKLGYAILAGRRPS